MILNAFDLRGITQDLFFSFFRKKRKEPKEKNETLGIMHQLSVSFLFCELFSFRKEKSEKSFALSYCFSTFCMSTRFL